MTKIAVGENRDEVVKRMSEALSEFKIQGISTTIYFHDELIKNEDFITSNYNTRWVENAMYRQ